MSNLYWLTETQMERLRPYFPKSRGRAQEKSWLQREGFDTIKGKYKKIYFKNHTDVISILSVDFFGLPRIGRKRQGITI